MTDNEGGNSWTAVDSQGHAAHKAPHNTYLCEQCSRLSAKTPTSKDNWDLFVEANWAPTLQAAFGKHWQQTAGSEVGAMLKVGRQQLNTQLGTRDVPLQQQAANHMLLVSNHHHASNASSGYDSPPEEAFHTLQDDSGSINSDSSQQAAAQPSRSTMDEWADIFDHCKTAMNGTGPNQAARVPHDQLPTFNMAMTPHLYVPPGGSMAFESVKSMNSEDIEDCMFGSDEDEPPELRGIKVTGLFRTSMDEWSRGPVQAAPQRRVFRRIKRGNNQPGKGAASAPAQAQAGNKAVLARPGPQQTPPILEPARLRPPGMRLHAEVKPMPDFSTFPVYDIRPSVMAEHGTDEPVLLTEESSAGSRVNSKKRSAPTTLVNTPQMLQQLAKEGSTGDSSCSSSAEDDSQLNDDSDDSEPDVIARHQHPFGTQNGLSNKPQHMPHANSNAGQKGMSMPMVHAHSLPNAFSGVPRVVPVSSVPPSAATSTRPAQTSQTSSCPYPVKGDGLGTKHTSPAVKANQAAGSAAKDKPVNGDPKQAQGQGKVSASGRQMLDMTDTFGRAPLHVAAAVGRVDIVQQLLFGGCDWTKSLQADYRELENMAHAGRKLPTQPPSANRPLILWAEDCVANGGPLPEMNAFGLPRKAVAGPYLAPVSFQGATALHLAAFYGHSGVTDLLLAAMACDVNACNAQGLTALHMAAHQGHASIVAQLCRNTPRVDIDAVDHAGCSPLHHATALGHDAVVMELWSKSANVDMADANGWTALHHAAEGGHLEVVAKLVIAGCNVSRYDHQGMSPGHLAAHHGYHQILDKLLLAGYALDMQGGLTALHGSVGSTALHVAARHGHLQMVERLLEAGANAQLVDVRGYTALQCAAEGGHMGPFRCLLQAGCDPLAWDHAGVTVLHSACQGGSVEIVHHLMQLGAQPLTKSLLGRDSLHYAALGSACAVMDVLLEQGGEQGCSLASTDNDGNTAWHAAAEGGHLEAVQRLLQAGAELESTNAAACTALHIAARSGWLPLVKMLLRKGANVCAVSKGRQTALHFAAAMGHVDVAAALLDEAAQELLMMKDEGNWTALHHAAEQGSVEIVELLLQAGAEVNVATDQEWTSLHLAAKEQNTHVMGVLLANSADGALKDCYGATPLHYAVQLADSNHFNTLHSSPRCVVKTPDSRGYTVLHHAVAGGNLEIVNTLLRTGHGQPDGDSNRKRITPLHVAAKHGRVVLLPLLMQAGYRAQAVTPDGKTTLHYAALGSAIEAWPSLVGARFGSNVETAELLLRAGAEVKIRDDAGCTPMHYAAGSGDLVLVERFILLGLSIMDQSQNGWDVLMWACLGGHAAVVSKLLSLGSNIAAKDAEQRLGLHWAAEKGHAEAVGVLVKEMLQANMDIQAQDGQGSTALQLAAQNRHVKTVAKLLDSAGTKEEKGYTALHLAVQVGNGDLVRQLLALPTCDPAAKDVDGLTALHWAASKGQLGMLAALLNRGSLVNGPTNDGWTALHEAAANGHALIVDKLLASGAQVDLKTSNGSTALHNAANCGHSAVVKQLLQAGASISQCALTGANALFNAATAGHTECVEVLLEAGCAVDAVTTSGSTALHSAASNGHALVVQRLITAGADVDVQAQNGSTALHNAAAGGHAKAVEALVAAPSCDCDVQNSNGNTALHLAASKGHTEAVEALLVASADPNIRNSKSWSAVQSAAANGHFEAVLRLVQHGASWRNKADCDVIKTLTRKSTLKPSYIEGRLRLAENRERQRGKTAGASVGNAPDTAAAGHSPEDLAAAERAAEAHAQELLQEELAAKELQERKKIRKKERKKKKRPDNEGEPQTAAVAASENEQAEGGESSDEATNRQNSPEPQQQPQLTADATTPGQKDRDGTAVLQSTPDEAASLHQKEPRAAAMLQSSTGKAAAIDVKADSVMGSGQTVQRKSPGEGRVSSARVVEGGAGQDEEAAAPDAATRAEGLAAEKPTNRRRRGGRNRNKAALAGDPVAPDRPAADESAVQDVADSMAQMQMERLASNGTAEASDMATDTSHNPARRRNKQHATAQPAVDVPVTDALSQPPSAAKPANASAGKALEKQKANGQKFSEAAPSSKAGDAQLGISAQSAAGKRSQPATMAAAQTASSGVSAGRLDGVAANTGIGKGSGSAASSIPSLKPVRDGQTQRQQQQQQQTGQVRSGVAAQQSRAAVADGSIKAAAASSSAKAATNYSAAVSGLAQSTAALSLNQPESAAQRNAAGVEAQGTSAAAPQGAVAAAHHGSTAAASEQRRQQRSRQQQQQQQEGVRHQHQQPRQHPKHQQQQQRQQTGPQRHAAPWESMPLSHGAYGQQGPQRSPSIDWSFQGLGQAAAVHPFARNASGSLPGMPAWAPELGLPQGPHAASPSRLQDSGRTGSYGNVNSLASRGSTSGFQVTSSPRGAQAGIRGQSGSNVHPSTGILSVQMNSTNQLPAPVEVSTAGSACMGFPAATSSGQGMSMLLPTSIANNIWAVGDGASELTGSAEQRPHMWSSPSRGSPLRPSYVGSAPLQRPSLSTSVEIRRAAEASGLCCPLTKDLMSDPVVLISDGYTYERAAITKWLEQNDTSPTTKAALQNKDMVPNLTMRSAIQLLIPSANSQRLFPSQLDRRRI